MVFLGQHFLPATFLFIAAARATNDWSKPCLSGECSYDVVNQTASGSVFISGSPKAISDLTTAAGWTILDCNSTAGAQDIRAVCTGNSTNCDHLYEGGAVGTLVRLPESCATMPFARVAKEWTHANQTVPSAVKEKLRRRNDGATVRGIRLDTNFAAVDPSQNGQVSLYIQGAIANGDSGNFTVTPPTRRGFFGDLGDDIANAAGDVKDAAGDVVGDVEDAAGDAVDALKSAAGDAADAVGDVVSDALSAMSFNVTKSNTQTLDVDKPFTLFDQSISCPAAGNIPAFNGEVKVAVEGKAHADITYGLVATGSLVPPSLSDFGLFANFDAQLNGILTVNASASASFDTGKVQIFQVGIPGLDFPGILAIGPSFVVNAEGLASLDTEVNMSVDLAYNVNNAKLFFPPNKGSSQGDFAPGDSALSLAANPSAAASGSFEAHIIPSVQFGINALDGAAQATINLDLDSSAKLTLSLKGDASASTSTNAGSNASGSINGCVDVSTSLSVNAGADASFLTLFDKSTNVSLFQKTFDLFNKCLGSGSSKRKLTRSRKHARDVLVRRGLTCPSSGAATLSSIAEQTVSASSIKAE